MRTTAEIDRLIALAERELAQLASRCSELTILISQLRQERDSLAQGDPDAGRWQPVCTVTSQSSQAAKIALIRGLFRAREDVYARRFESRKTGKGGYQPACRNEWSREICERPKIRCEDCTHREFLPVTDEVIRSHLLGMDPQDRQGRDFTIGVYPMLADETSRFLAADFDKATWREDVRAFLETCRMHDVPAALERSRSGNGGHVWMFFSEPIPAALVRKVGTFLLTKTMERRPELGMDSYDRLFPGQDTLPKGGFGSLIALPLQRKPREDGNSLFLDEDFTPHSDQWAFLASVRKMTRQDVDEFVYEAEKQGEAVGVRIPVTNEDDAEPWSAPPSRKWKEPPVVGRLPEKIRLVLGNQIYIPKDEITPSLRNRLIRLAAFQNPEFFRAQAMRISTFGKPRVISCCEDYPNHLALPRGCLDEVLELFQTLQVETETVDQRFCGEPLEATFCGTLRAEQQQAADALLRYDTGVLAASTAFGKTIVAAYLIARRKVNTIVVVHRRQLMDQWIGMLGKFIDLDGAEIGQIGGGKRGPVGKVDVAMMQSLCRRGVVDDLVGNYGHLIIDECHHISAASFEQVVRQSKARYVTGLSATVVRKDGHHPIIFMQCGPVRYRVDDRKHAESRPFDHKVIVRPTRFCLPHHLEDTALQHIHDLYALLARDEERNGMIVEDLLAALRSNRSPVLLTERRDHLDLLAGLLSPHVQNLILMTGGMGKKQRQRLAERLAGIPSDQERVILATGRYLGEGFDDARLDTLFLALPISWRGTLTQYAGRLHRLNASKKDVIIYDYVDLEVPVLARMYARRRAGYKSIGYSLYHRPGAGSSEPSAAT